MKEEQEDSNHGRKTRRWQRGQQGSRTQRHFFFLVTGLKAVLESKVGQDVKLHKTDGLLRLPMKQSGRLRARK